MHFNWIHPPPLLSPLCPISPFISPPFPSHFPFLPIPHPLLSPPPLPFLNLPSLLRKVSSICIDYYWLILKRLLSDVAQCLGLFLGGLEENYHFWNRMLIWNGLGCHHVFIARSQKYPYPPCGKSLEILMGWRSQEFPEGWGAHTKITSLFVSSALYCHDMKQTNNSKKFQGKWLI